ncbi:MAG: pyridoxamine 5'-phosphate oxidase family protein [Anaerolineae bacterium]|nr:pyridoxamine 5'-phosphate oxidase family protein [Anaerolineae bacterium]
MTAETPVTELLPSSVEHAAPTPWVEARRRLAEAGWFWLATTRADGRPHVMPLLAVWLDEALYFATSPATVKGKNLVRKAHCVLATASADAHLVVEGRAAKVHDDTMLYRVADAYASKYDWHVAVRDSAFYADGAPTAGPPPYEVYQVKPEVVFGFGTDDAFSPTRWRFGKR